MLMRRRMPYEEMDVLSERLERSFEEMFGAWPTGGRSWSLPIEGRATWSPPMDVHEDDRTLAVKLQLPGIEKKDVKISVSGDVVEIRGERKESYDTSRGGFHLTETQYGAFARTFTLPSYVDPEKARASFKHGELTVTFPKQERSAGRTITIGGQGTSKVTGWFEQLAQRLRSWFGRQPSRNRALQYHAGVKPTPASC